MLKYCISFLIFIALCATVVPLYGQQVSGFECGIPYSTVCTNSEGIVNCSKKTITDIDVAYGSPVNLAVSYIDFLTTASGQICSLEEQLDFIITKSQPLNLFPLTFLHTVRTLSSVAGANGGTVNSPYGQYQAYAVETPRRDYQVTVKIMKGSVLFETINLLVDQPIVQVSNQHVIIASLLGEDVSAAGNSDFTGSVLFLPVKQNGLMEPVWEGLLMPQSLAAGIIDARQLNQLRDADLGVTFYEPAPLPDPESDEDPESGPDDDIVFQPIPTAKPGYLVKNIPAFTDTNISQWYGYSLVQPIKEIVYSRVRLEMDHAQIGFVDVESVGYMPMAYADNFESLSRAGNIHVGIKNQGTNRAVYQSVIRDCYPGIEIPVISKSIELNPNEEGALVFELPVNQNMQATHYCWVDLISQKGTLFDSVQIYWDTLGSETSRFKF